MEPIRNKPNTTQSKHTTLHLYPLFITSFSTLVDMVRQGISDIPPSSRNISTHSQEEAYPRSMSLGYAPCA